MYILLFSPHNKGIFCTYFAFCFVLCLFLRTFANDHRYIPQRRAGVTFVGKTITALAVISENIET